MKKILSALLATLLLFSSMATVSSFADGDNDGWKTVSCNPYDELLGAVDPNTTYTVSANGNNIKVQIKSEYINGDTLSCGGTKDKHLDLLGDAIEVIVFDVTFEDDRDNKIRYWVSCPCGEGSEAHTTSIKDDCRYAVYYAFHKGEKGKVDEGTEYLDSVGGYVDGEGHYNSGGYVGKFDECTSLNIKVEGDTLTMTTVLPSAVVDYDNETRRDLNFNSENFTVSGSNQCGVYNPSEEKAPEESKGFIREWLEKAAEVFAKFFELLKKFFSFDFAK